MPLTNIKFAVYKIFNGTDFDTVYFKAPASAITETVTKDGIPGRQFITPENNILITDYLNTFNVSSKLVKLGTDGKIPKALINEDFANYLDKRHTPGALQNVASEVTFTHANGVTIQNGIELNQKDTTDVNTNKISAANGLIKLSVGTDALRQEIEFTKAGTLDFKKKTTINNIEIGDDDSAVPKSYVDNAIESGGKPVASVKAATAASVTTVPPSGENAFKPDGIEVEAGDRVLIKNQLNNVGNGIYEVSTGVWTKVDEDNMTGALVFVEEGTTLNDSKWFHKGDGEWIKFSQTDQLKFPANGGLVRTGDDVKLQTNYITDGHIKSDAGIDLSKLDYHVGNITGWDLDTTQASPITGAIPISERLTDLAMVISKIRGHSGNIQNYGEWSANSLTLPKLKTAIDDVAENKQNPVQVGETDPSPSLFNKGDVFLLYDTSS